MTKIPVKPLPMNKHEEILSKYCFKATHYGNTELVHKSDALKAMREIAFEAWLEVYRINTSYYGDERDTPVTHNSGMLRLEFNTWWNEQLKAT